jgi:hypothetical protein
VSGSAYDLGLNVDSIVADETLLSGMAGLGIEGGAVEFE